MHLLWGTRMAKVSKSKIFAMQCQICLLYAMLVCSLAVKMTPHDSYNEPQAIAYYFEAKAVIKAAKANTFTVSTSIHLSNLEASDLKTSTQMPRVNIEVKRYVSHGTSKNCVLVIQSVYRLKAIKNPAPATADMLMAANVLALLLAASGVAAGVVLGTTATTEFCYRQAASKCTDSAVDCDAQAA